MTAPTFAGSSDPLLPPAVSKLSRPLRSRWVEVFNAAADRNPEDPGICFRAAWGAVRALDKEKRSLKRASALPDLSNDGGVTMPWQVAKTGSESEPWCVHKKNEDGSLGETIKGGCHATEDEAKQHAAALYANVEEKELQASFKAYTQSDGRTRFELVSSGGFEDRDGEIVTTKFLESCVDLADRTKERGPLLIFHVPGSAIGTVDCQAVIGDPGFLFETGLFDDSPDGRAAADYYTEHAKETGVSIKFLYANRTSDGVYTPPGVILERSLMRRERAAFPWSALDLSEVNNDMAKMSREKREELRAVLGSQRVAEIEEQLQDSAEALKQAGVRAKAVAEREIPSAAGGPSEAKAASAPESLAGAESFELVLTPDALDSIAAKAAASVGARIAALESQLQATLNGLNELRTAVEKNAQNLIALQRGEEEKIAEKVAHLPRATVRRLQAADMYRPTSKEAVDGDASSGDDDYLQRMKKIVHG